MDEDLLRHVETRSGEAIVSHQVQGDGTLVVWYDGRYEPVNVGELAEWHEHLHQIGPWQGGYGGDEGGAGAAAEPGQGEFVEESARTFVAASAVEAYDLYRVAVVTVGSGLGPPELVESVRSIVRAVLGRLRAGLHHRRDSKYHISKLQDMAGEVVDSALESHRHDLMVRDDGPPNVRDLLRAMAPALSVVSFCDQRKFLYKLECAGSRILLRAFHIVYDSPTSLTQHNTHPSREANPPGDRATLD
ncbi:MAG: hypothetical protein ACKVLK_17235, partial [Spongiibacter sp.]